MSLVLLSYSQNGFIHSGFFFQNVVSLFAWDLENLMRVDELSFLINKSISNIY